MKVEDIMTKEVRTCRPETNLAEAAMQMWRGDCGVLPVVTDGGKVIGMITDRDICMAAATKPRDAANIHVREVTSGKVYSCSPQSDIHEALRIMGERQVRRLPVTDAQTGRLAGIVSMNDVALRAQGGARAELSSEDVERTMRGICAHRELPLAKPAQQLVPKLATA